jgi:hypothetical protein
MNEPVKKSARQVSAAPQTAVAVATDDFITVEQLAARLGWSPKTVQNKMNVIFKKGIHYAQAPGLPVLFKWSAVLELYDWKPEPVTSPAPDTNRGLIPMARGYSMK